jgi:hypothetical protein
MVELMERLYNRPEEGFFINEFFGKRHGTPQSPSRVGGQRCLAMD